MSCSGSSDRSSWEILTSKTSLELQSIYIQLFPKRCGSPSRLSPGMKMAYIASQWQPCRKYVFHLSSSFIFARRFNTILHADVPITWISTIPGAMIMRVSWTRTLRTMAWTMETINHGSIVSPETQSQPLRGCKTISYAVSGKHTLNATHSATSTPLTQPTAGTWALVCPPEYSD